MSTPYEHVERSVYDGNGREIILFYTGRSMFSNFYHSPIVVDNKTYPTAEHYYQCRKALYFGDHERFDAIYAAPRPAQAKHLAREIKNFKDYIWQAAAPRVMEQVVYLKFSQNNVLRNRLLSTGDAALVEATEFDSFWGSGLNIMDNDNAVEANRKGANVLGRILMSVRERIR